MKLVFLGERRASVAGGVAAVEMRLMPYAQQVFPISSSVLLGAENADLWLHSLDGKVRWRKADPTPKPFASGEHIVLSFFDLEMVTDPYTNDRYIFRRTIDLHTFRQLSAGAIQLSKVASLFHTFRGPVAWNADGFVKVARPTEEIAYTLRGESAKVLLAWLGLPFLDRITAQQKYPGFAFDNPPEEGLDRHSKRWRLIGYPLRGFLLWKAADRNHKQFLT